MSSGSDPSHLARSESHDALNRATSRSYSDTTPAVTYAYDSGSITNGKGRLASVSSSVSTYSYSGYDAAGKVLGGSETLGAQSYSMSYSYNLAGQVNTTSYPSGHTVTNTYDSVGRLQSLSGTLGDNTLRTYTSGLVYDASNRMKQEQFGTTIPIFNKLFYNSRGQLAEIREGLTGNDTSFDYGAIINFYSGCFGVCAGQSMPDNNGNLQKQAVYLPGTMWYQQYEYDNLNRLQRVHEHNAADQTLWQQEYIYDRYGNRTIHQTNTWPAGIPKPDFTVNTGNNRLGVPGGQTGVMTYDNAGNLTTDTYSAAAVARAYDAENRMTSETQPNSYVAGTYSYDGDGRRVKRNVGGIETWQVYGIGGELVAEYALNGSPSSPQKEYGYRNGQLLITAAPGTSWGSPPVITDNPLNPNYVGETPVRALHITELRTAINALRTHLGMSAYTWTTSATTSDWITIGPIVEMRTALDQVLGAPSPAYASGLAQGQPIKAIHIQELRDRVTAAWSAGASLQMNWLVTDQLGTPRMIFDKTGSLANTKRHDYLPFGEELSASTALRTTAQGYSVADNIRQKFTSKERDIETGLDFFLARYYSSIQGRFASYDPVFITPKRLMDPQRLNLYAYARNNPLMFIDLVGMDITITAKNEQEARKKFSIFLLGLKSADRSHVHIFAGNGKNGYAKGQFYVLADARYKSDSENFRAVQRGANDRTAVGRITVLNQGETWKARFLEGSISHPTLTSTSATYAGKNDFQGYTLFQIRGKGQVGELYSAGNYTEAYVNGDQTDIELAVTMHHELRAHMILGDFGRNIPKARHSDPYARGQGPPTSEADRVAEAAEKEVRENAAKKP